MNYEDIKKLIQDMGDSKIDSLDIEFPEGMKISMKKDKQMVEKRITENTMLVENAKVTNKTVSNTTEEFNTITSPMVGTFYQSASPEKPAFVKVGDKVKKGDVLCIIEAMKLMNEVEAEYEGEIIEICVKDQDMVEYGKPLFKIR